MEKLNAFEKQTLNSLLEERTTNGMSRFYLVINQSQTPSYPKDPLCKK